MNHPPITFVGAGQMARCIIQGLIEKGTPADTLTVTNPSPDKLEHFATLGLHTHADNTVGCQQAGVIVLAVKPQAMKSVLNELADLIQHQQPLLISLAVGIRCETLQGWLSPNTAIIRCMPNTPALIGAGMTGLYANAQTTETQKSLAETMMMAIGQVLWLQEEQGIDALASISGSGPAYVFRIMEALEAAALALGFNQEDAKQLTRQTTLGAARLAMAHQDKGLSELRAQVTSKGGTTEAALKVLESVDLNALFREATQAACERATQLDNLYS